jgi:hypothetical protein
VCIRSVVKEGMPGRHAKRPLVGWRRGRCHPRLVTDAGVTPVIPVEPGEPVAPLALCSLLGPDGSVGARGEECPTGRLVRRMAPSQDTSTSRLECSVDDPKALDERNPVAIGVVDTGSPDTLVGRLDLVEHQAPRREFSGLRLQIVNGEVEKR